MSDLNYYEIYRKTSHTMAEPPKFSLWLNDSSIGLTLMDTLDELISTRRMEPQLAIKIMQNFDKALADVISEKVKARMSFKGHLDTYRFCDDVWTFIIKDITFKMDNSQSLTADKIKIVSNNSSRPGN
ncbi:Transcription initiation factor IIA subunit 2 [Diplodia intermedia]|uniref:Transcription initiation factor IIA subunit 2 n=1 Tax=Diplodia intermedia TaxID=856260 RepID=A0ABR3U582_9PEZI